jgi:type I protein arginine methyltransferase
VYSLSDYLWMIADRARVDAYTAALRAAITPATRVVEIGAGFGFFSVIAAHAGAAHVDALETNPVIHLAPRLAAANGCADRISFHHCAADRFAPRHQADVMLIDVRGPTPFGRRSLQTLIDARDRLLRPGGTIIARTDHVMVAPAQTPDVFRREVQAARGAGGLNLQLVERIAYDTPIQCAISPGDLVAGGELWVSIDYAGVTRTEAAGSVSWMFEEEQRVEGLAVWFDTDLGAGYTYSSQPGAISSPYRQMFIPFREPIEIDAGDGFRLELSVRQLRDNNIWAWRGWRRRPGAPERLEVDQNSLAEIVLAPETLPSTSGHSTPALGPRGRALLGLLSHFDGRQPLSRLSEQLSAQAPDLFDHAAAVEFASEWAARVAALERGGEC